ncbi:MAG: Stk1 family PASTA domain-containing Ser/Thr kinase [Lachnospiraceae bacterium]|nr:Stk1 family PASTA domain-containing Ser/Thr kinase [Lachnospiraceae bacterium]
MLEPGSILDGRYTIESKIGQGGMSTVYRAVDGKLGRSVAIKALKEEFSSDDDFVLKFRNEAQSVASLVHPNIVGAYDAVDEGDLHYIVMELVDGVSLKNYIQNKNALSNDECIDIALQTAEGISAAHKAGIVHRDIKPQNIIISNEGKVKVADFGIAKAVTGETISTAILGSAHYVSPEQAKSGNSDERSDIYSLGITMYEMITGRLPFDGENTVSVVMAHINTAMVPPKVYNDDIYGSLNDIILKCTRKNPKERYQSADELIADLKKCQENPDGHFVSLYETEKKTKSQESGGNARENGEGHSRGRSRSHPVDTLVNKKVLLGLAAMAFFAVAAVLLVHSSKKPVKVPEETTTTEAVVTTPQETSSAVDIVIAAEQTVPSILGLTEEEAKALLNDEHLVLVINSEEYNDVYLAGRIVNQSPAEGEGIKKGDKIYAVISLGSKLDSVINSLKGITIEEATKRLLSVGVNVNGTKRQFSDDVDDGLVIGYLLDDITAEGETKASGENDDNQISSEAISGSKVTEGSTVKLLISAGKESEGVIMPTLTSLSYQEAISVIMSNGLTVGSVVMIPSDDPPTGKVTAQSIQPNELIKKGTEVNIRVDWNEGTPIEPESTTAAETVSETTGEDEVISPDFWYGSIDTEYQIGEFIGPAVSANTVNVAIRLLQRVSDGYEYTTLSEPKPMSAGTRFPICFRHIRGVPGIDKGTVEVYDSDTGNSIVAYEINFYPAQ